MVNKNYARGRSKEHYQASKLKKQGYDIAQRTAGSHSPFDIIAIDKKNFKILLRQCKPSSMSDNAKGKILEENWELNGLFTVEFDVE